MNKVLAVGALLAYSMALFGQVPKEFERVKGQPVAQVSVGSAQHVWARNASDHLFRWHKDKWSKAKGKLKHISVGSDGAVWGLGGKHGSGGWNVYQRVGITEKNPLGRGWKKMPGRLSTISVADANTIWGIRGGQQVVRWNSNQNRWNKISEETFLDIDVASDGTIRALNNIKASTDLKVFKRVGVTLDNPTGTGWEEVIGSVEKIAVGSEQHIWALTKDKKLMKWTGMLWKPIEGQFESVDVGSDGEAWFLGGKHVGGGWQVFRKPAQVTIGADDPPVDQVPQSFAQPDVSEQAHAVRAVLQPVPLPPGPGEPVPVVASPSPQVPDIPTPLPPSPIVSEPLPLPPGQPGYQPTPPVVPEPLSLPQEQPGYQPVDQYGNVIGQAPGPVDQYGQSLQQVDQYGNPIGQPTAPIMSTPDQLPFPQAQPGYQPADQFGQATQQVDQFGNPVVPQPVVAQPVDQYGQPLQEVDQFGNPVTSQPESAQPFIRQPSGQQQFMPQPSVGPIGTQYP